MSAELIAEEYSHRIETIAGSPIAITCYRLGSTYYAKAEIHVPGAMARIASAQDSDCKTAEEKVVAEARVALGKRV